MILNASIRDDNRRGGIRQYSEGDVVKISYVILDASIRDDNGGGEVRQCSEYYDLSSVLSKRYPLVLSNT